MEYKVLESLEGEYAKVDIVLVTDEDKSGIVVCRYYEDPDFPDAHQYSEGQSPEEQWSNIQNSGITVSCGNQYIGSVPLQNYHTVIIHSNGERTWFDTIMTDPLTHDGFIAANRYANCAAHATGDYFGIVIPYIPLLGFGDD